MSKITAEQYKKVSRDMDVRELVRLSDQYNQAKNLTSNEAIIKDILDAEMERRIYIWEMATV